MSKKESVIVVDFGDHSIQTVARKVRDLGVYSEIVPYTKGVQGLKELNPKGFIFSGDAVDSSMVRELKKDGFKVLHDDNLEKDNLLMFLKTVCNCAQGWTPQSFIYDEIAKIKDQVGNERVLCGLSGGVDSAVTAALIHRAVGDQLTCVFVDTGLMRMKEKESIKEAFENSMHVNLVIVDAEERFLSALKGVTEPEKKRKIIGELFIRVFEEESAKLGNFKYLAQGTVYPDVIESVSVKHGDVAVKSHHNVGGLPEDMKFKLVEPLRELFKDEVRKVGKLLGLPDEIVMRHPFPGPGLAVRVIGEVTKVRCDMLRKADAIAIEEIKSAGLYDDIWQAFCILLPVMSVGVKTGTRTYEQVAGLRAIKGTDGMTAEWYKFPYEVLDKISNRIIYEVDGISRLVYDISSKPPATIEWE